MKTRHALVGMAAAGAAVVGLLPSPAAAEETTCRGTLGRVTVDNLRVPQAATCALSGTYVKGTIKVERGATLKAGNVQVIGNVQGENAALVSVTNGSRVGGSVQVVQGRAATVTASADGHDRSTDAAANRSGVEHATAASAGHQVGRHRADHPTAALGPHRPAATPSRHRR